MNDPQWFWSSLAQVSAGLVGLLGGFLLVRLSSYIADWREGRTTLLRLERDWRGAEAALLRRQAAAESADPRGDDRDRRREARERAEEAWFSLRAADDERESARFPGELVVTLAVLAGLLLTGVVAPLLALGAPGNATQALYVATIAVLVVGVGLVMTAAAVAAFRAWRDVALGDTTMARIAADRLDDGG